MDESQFLQGLSDEQYQAFRNGDMSKLNDDQYKALKEIKYSAGANLIEDPRGSFSKTVPTTLTSAALTIPGVESLGVMAAKATGNEDGFNNFMKQHALNREKYGDYATVGDAAGYAAQLGTGLGGKLVTGGGNLFGKVVPKSAEVIKPVVQGAGRIATTGAITAADDSIRGMDGVEGGSNAMGIQAVLEGIGIPLKGARWVSKTMANSALDLPEDLVDAYRKNPSAIDNSRNFGKLAGDFVDDAAKIGDKVNDRSKESRKYLEPGWFSVDRFKTIRDNMAKEIKGHPTMSEASKIDALNALEEAWSEVAGKKKNIFQPNDVKDVLIKLDQNSKYGKDQLTDRKTVTEIRNQFRGKINEQLRESSSAYADYMDEFVAPLKKSESAAKEIIPKKNRDPLANRLRSAGRDPDERSTTMGALKKFDEGMGTKYADDVVNASRKEMLDIPIGGPDRYRLPTGNGMDIMRKATLAIIGGDKRKAIGIIHGAPAKFVGKLIDGVSGGSIGLALAHKSLLEDPEYRAYIEGE